jgi:flagellar motility protein MotE (MotC chaperone)
MKMKTLIYLFLFFIIILSIGYVYYEFTKINSVNMEKPFHDYKSYFAYIFQKVPYLNKFLEYSPKKILSVDALLNEQVNIINSKLNEEYKGILAQKQEILLKEKELADRERKLNNLMKIYQKENQQITKEKEQWSDYKTRIAKLSSWLSGADPSQIVLSLTDTSISATDIAIALMQMQTSNAADIIQELGKIDSAKAAKIIALMSSKTFKIK